MLLKIDDCELGEVEDYRFEAFLDELTIVGINTTRYSRCWLSIGVGDECKISLTENNKEFLYTGTYFSMIVPDHQNDIVLVFRPSNLLGITELNNSVLRVDKTGSRCRECKESNPWAEATFPDGTYLCFTCRERKKSHG